MEVATATPSNGNGPFHDHDVREWSRLDNLTGVLERTRIETDHWAANTNNSSHKYGKVVDSRARTDADGALRQQARRQLEVFQSQVPGGQLQVIKSHSHSVSSSSSRWTNKKLESELEFEGLEIPTNPLDLSFQKSKALLGRSVARRPPTRTKNKEENSPTNPFNPHLTASENLQKVTRLCHQIHENALNQAFGKYTNNSSISERLNLTKPANLISNTKTNLSRTKSSSSEDFLINLKNDKSTKSIEDLEDLEQLQTWRRTSKIRRSLQYAKQDRPASKPIDLPENSVSVRKITEDFEKGRRLSTALRGNSVDLQALDQILQSISSSSSDKSDKTDEDHVPVGVVKAKRDSFVTVESLQEIKGKLRRTSSPDREIDDGIVTEDTNEAMIDSAQISSQSKVKSYVYGMESNLNKKPVIGTGSLESRSKLLNGTTNRSEDWYNRRKSYGFEPVQNPNETMSSSSKKNLVESSTDSGICRSSEVIVVPSVIKSNNSNRYSEDDNDDDDDNWDNDVKNKLLNESSTFGNVKKISSLFDNVSNKTNNNNHFGVKKDENYTWKKGAPNNKDNIWNLNSGITIKIPIVSNNHWSDEPEREAKRHSIAVDETKYVSQNKKDVNEARRTSLIITNNNDDDFSMFGKKSKKVEFCKTEVHFAAESGKVNIVETDEKPPPTQNFRRRRRNPNALNYLNDYNKSEFPLLHFGENYAEKSLFANGNLQFSEDDGEATEKIISPIVTVNSDSNYSSMFEDDKRELNENENRKGILKNKIIKPKPYHLGEYPMSFNVDEENHNHHHNSESGGTPLWKSTITLSNTLYDKKMEEISKNFDPTNQPDLIKDQLMKRLSSETPDKPKPFLTVAERIRNMEESQKLENYKGYSTRVNIGDGQAIVVENKPDIFMEPSKNEAKESKQILKKGLVVRIGRDSSSAKHHMVCSKTTTNQNSPNTTTTTKITIDLSPTERKTPPVYAKQNTNINGSHNFKSTSLILNTIKTSSQNELEKNPHPQPQLIPRQLEALKRLYEEENSDSDADKEVQFLTSRIAENCEKIEDDDNSVVSGSWSRMRAYKNVSENSFPNIQSSHAQLEKGKYFNKSNITNNQHQVEEPVRIKAEIKNKKYSPIVLRKYTPSPYVKNNNELNVSKNLSSPSLVAVKQKEETKEKIEKIVKEEKSTDSFDSKKVLRQPKKSEMAYFGIQNSNGKIVDSKSETELISKTESTSPIYENVSPVPTKKSEAAKPREFDACILDELTKAADEILQAVKDYSEEESKKLTREKEEVKTELTTINENKSWKHQQENAKPVSRPCKSKLSNASSNSSLEAAANVSSPKENHSAKPSHHRYISNTKSSADKIRTKMGSSKTDENSGHKAQTRARRLQRASSREALLQAHGSSSEDLATNEVPLRKPRLIRKTKTNQLTINNGLDMSSRGTASTNAKRKSEATKTNNYNKPEESRLPGALPEIRHKTAISTIRSTGEKSDRSAKLRVEDTKKKTPPYKDIIKGSSLPVNPLKNKRETVTHRLATAYVPACNPRPRKLRKLHDYYENQDYCPCLCS